MTTDNLYSAIWADFKRGATLISSRHGACLPHGIAAARISSSLECDALTKQYLRRSDRIVLDQNAVILLGSPEEFGPCGDRLLCSIGYPARFEILREGFANVIRDREAADPLSCANSRQADLGLVVRGRSRDLSGRATVLIMGTSPLGVLAAAMWATQACVAEIAAPECFPGQPIEALVRALPCGNCLPSEFDLETVRLVCGDLEYDLVNAGWVHAKRQTLIQVILHNGEARSIRIGNHLIPVNDTDLSQLLLILINRTVKSKPVSMAEAQYKIDEMEIPTRIRTLNNRRADIAKLSTDPTFVHETIREDGQKAYSLNATIEFIESETAFPGARLV